jgi:hypothetical protein
MPGPAIRTDQNPRILQRVPSVLLNSPTRSGKNELNRLNPQSKPHVSERRKKAMAEWEGEIIPDSEEERVG